MKGLWSKADEAFGCIGILAIIAALIAVVPIILIWALNTLFPVEIELTWKTWLAALTISLILSGSSSSK